MISKFENDYDLKKEMNAIVLENSNIASKNSKLKLYVPSLMTNIKKGDPLISKITSTSISSVFKNANKKPAVTRKILRDRNYLTASIQNDSTIDNTKKTISFITGIDPGRVVYTVYKGTKIRTKFLNGKITKMCYITNEETDASLTMQKNP